MRRLRVLGLLFAIAGLLVYLPALSVPAHAQVISVFGPLAGNPNVWTGSNQFTNGVTLGPVTVSQLSGLTGLSTIVVVSNATPGSNPCTSGGTGALATYVNGQWNCGAGGGAGTVTSVTASAPLSGGTITASGSIGLTPCSTSQTWVWNGSAWACTTIGSASFPTNQSNGDTIRYNIYGDSKWETAQSGMGISLGWYEDQAQGVPICYGAIGCTHPVAEGSYATVYANGTNSAGSTYSAAATPSTSDVIGMDVGAGGNFGDWGFGNFYRLTFSWAASTTTNVRYWLGMTAFNTSGAGCSNAPPRSTTCYATNTPNTSALAFRYSAGTDTFWQAVSINAGTATVTSTGVVPNTSPHLFEIAAVTSGSGYNYYIDGTLVATITTNLPSVTSGSSNTQTIIFWAGDNENTSTAIAGTSYWMSMSEK